MSHIEQISAEEAHSRATAGAADDARTVVMLDVRTVKEFEDGHPAGAINVPVAVPGLWGLEPNPDFLAVVAAAVPKDAEVIATCRTGQRSMMACQMLAADGWTKLANLRPGWAGHVDGRGRVQEAGWAALNLPSESGPQDGRNFEDLKRAAGLD